VRLLKGNIDEWLKILLQHHSTTLKKKHKATLAFSIYLQNTIPSPLNGTANQNKKIWQYENHTL